MEKELHFEKLSQAEEQEDIEFFHDSQEYREGKTPFAYRYLFPDGKTLNASQDENGFGHVVIIEKGGTIFDFSNLVPSDVKFVTPTYFEKHPDDKIGADVFRERGGWGSHVLWKKIFCGEFKNPQHILSLLHEMGHINNTEENFRRRLAYFGAQDSEDMSRGQAIVDEEFIKLESKIERGAWSWALVAFQKISRETGADFSHIFPTFQDIKNIVRRSLRTYRHGYEWFVKEDYDNNFYKEMEKLFDRWKYAPTAGEQKNKSFLKHGRS